MRVLRTQTLKPTDLRTLRFSFSAVSRHRLKIHVERVDDVADAICNRWFFHTHPVIARCTQITVFSTPTTSENTLVHAIIARIERILLREIPKRLVYQDVLSVEFIAI